ncbi:hypothetical protein COV24_00865 [candidate division WWE3 bacterium CG10_big_fil_rev_8_21_14_0_10_32_10]|uniref:Glycosyltransferase 2-like domain-containing protein n=1 Tax=candidate division WWE3 bacterium CG10_big_fil_rev_8_21_14_0_10_32_10 TaxID=1975090 RepID=A0A2H0RD81_UNCKA|nr:MAG: hypothetical protein COV24_00865 [candidate division WWE3 bacterium CG10_big_fil_rev_8_21_14_0_10_32_10]
MSRKVKILNRILEILPGFLTWILLLSPLLIGYFFPNFVVFILTFLTIFWVYKVLNGVAGIITGYRKYKKDISVDWGSKVLNLDYSTLPDKKTLPDSIDSIRHFILIPIYSEPIEIIRESFKYILNSSVPNKSILIVYAIEQKYSEKVINDIEVVQNELNKSKEIEIMYFVHPQNIQGEVMGVAGPNRDWAARKAVKQLQDRGDNLDNYIFTTIDADVQIHKNFLSRISYLYLTEQKRKNRFYETAVHVFDNNTWRVPFINRIAADGITIALLATWSTLNWPTTTEQMDTFSCYSCALTTLVLADFWDPSVGIDDSVFFWRAFKALDGDFEGIPFYIPIHLDAAEGSGYVSSHLSLYKQQLRWGWGIITFPMSMLILPSAKKASILDKLSHIWVKFEHFVILRVLAFLLTFGFSMLTFVNENVKQANYAYAIPKINSLLLTVTLVGLIPLFFVRRGLKKPMPKNWSFLKKLLVTLFDLPAIYINYLTFGFIPWLEAQTKLMLGKKYKSLYYTPKFR